MWQICDVRRPVKYRLYKFPVRWCTCKIAGQRVLPIWLIAQVSGVNVLCTAISSHTKGIIATVLLQMLGKFISQQGHGRKGFGGRPNHSYWMRIAETVDNTQRDSPPSILGHVVCPVTCVKLTEPLHQYVGKWRDPYHCLVSISFIVACFPNILTCIMVEIYTKHSKHNMT